MDETGKNTGFKIFSIALFLILVLVGIFACVPMVQSENLQIMQKAEAGDVNGMEPEADITFTAEPTGTDGPDTTEEPASTPKPSVTPAASSTQAPSASAAPNRLKKVSGVTLVRYSTHSIKVTWNKLKKAKFYRVYYTKKKGGNGRLAAVTKKTQYRVKKLKNNTKYYFYVVACKKRKASNSDSNPSKTVHMKTKTYVHKTVFAGDSICQGIAFGQAFPQMHFTGKKKVIAYVGLNTVTFHTNRVFDGKTGLQKLISEKPYRVYMMLGMNEVHYRRISDMIAEYKDMVRTIQKASPNTDIVLCAISPVTRAERARNPGFSQLPLFNKRLKKLAKKMGATYFDYTSFLKDSSGYLKAEYAERDGYHWKAPAYIEFGKVVNKFEKSLDK